MSSKATITAKVKFFGGPEDGAEKRMPFPLNGCIDVAGHAFDKEHAGGVHETGQFQYHYHLNLEGQEVTGLQRYYRMTGYVYVFVADWVENWIKDGVKVGGDEMKKFGVGEVLQDEDEALTKEATREWTPQDEQALNKETED